MRRQILVVTGTIALLALIAYFVARDGAVDALSDLGPQELALLLLLSVVSLIVRGLQLSNVARPFGVNVGTAEATGLSAMHTLSNYLPARGGIIVRGAYLREVHGLGVADYTAMTALWMFGSLATAVVVGLAVGLTGQAGSGVAPTTAVFAACGAVLAVGYALLERLTGRGAGSGRLSRAVQRLNLGLRLGRRPAPWRRWFVVYSFAILVVGAVRFWVILAFVGSEASLFDALVVQALMGLALIVSITPGNIGIREGVAGLAAMLVAVSVDLALLAALIDRALGLIVAIAGFGLLGRPLASRLRDGSRSSTDQ